MFSFQQLLLVYFIVLMFFTTSNANFKFELLYDKQNNNKSGVNQMLESVETSILQQRTILMMRRRSKTTPFHFSMATVTIPSQVVFSAFVAFLHIGSPPQKIILSVDTGSHFTWMRCNYDCQKQQQCPSSRRIQNPSGTSMFKANASSSFKLVPCMSKLCKETTSAVGCDPAERTTSSACYYMTRYGDESRSSGLLATETVTTSEYKEGGIELQDVVIGCNTLTVGKFRGDGILGIGYGKNSLSTKIFEKLGDSFSYCWNNILEKKKIKQVNNYLTFGSIASSMHIQMQYTPLYLQNQPFYNVNVTGFSMNGRIMNIPSHIWNIKYGGVIIDSGTDLTLLPSVVYNPLINALKDPIMKGKYKLVGNGHPVCFATTGQELNFDESIIPTISIQFENGVEFKPPVRNYVPEVQPGVRCFAFARGDEGSNLSIIGNIMQQGFHWSFDLGMKRLGFAPNANCAG